jgi:flagellar biosynthetic protein FlhB
MASDGRTEKATPKRRNEARKKGQVAKSVDLNTVFVLAATLGALIALGPHLVRSLESIVSQGLAQTGDASNVTPGGMRSLGIWAMRSFATTAGPLVGIALVAGLAANVLQVRPRISPAALQPSLSKLNPMSGLKRMVGKDAVVQAVKALAKATAVGSGAFVALWPKLPTLGQLVGMPPESMFGVAGKLVSGLALRVLVVFAVIAVADFFWQRHRLDQRLRMTKEEVKQEHRQTDLPPEVKRMLRRRQMEAARRRMMAAVPTADAVVVNPTHFAVALRYDGKKPAPEVVAKGVDLVAAAIRRVAEEHGVPVVTNPPLARALYREVELDQQIPEQFFMAVAEVLAFVFRTARRRGTVRRALSA